jgi:hypothetical protein
MDGQYIDSFHTDNRVFEYGIYFFWGLEMQREFLELE